MKTLTISFCVLFLVIISALPVSAEPELYFGKVETLEDGSRIVSLMVKDVTNLGSCDANIEFTTSEVEVTGITSGDGNALTVQNKKIDNIAGVVQITAWDASTAHSGTVIICNIVYMGSDSNPFKISSAELFDYDSYEKIPLRKVGLIISNVSITGITADSAIITWDTNGLSSSLVKYGTESSNYTLQKYDLVNVTSHSIHLFGLIPDTAYYFVVNSTDQYGNSNQSNEYDFTTEILRIPLQAGWNLISLPLIPEDTGVDMVLSPIMGDYSIIWAYNASDTADHWKKYDPNAPFGNDLAYMETGEGYWIMMTSDNALNISGTVSGSIEIDLLRGWNLIGYNSLDHQPIAEVLSSISGNYSIVWAYNASDTADHWKKYDPGAPYGNDLKIMEPGKGYWIMMSVNDYLKYSFSPKY